jgi:uracil-DNA glycosylase
MDSLNQEIIACHACPRLVAWCEQVAREKRKSYLGDDYWGKPVPNFGDPLADRLIVGLAPAAHGANRTGQMFTGDRSGDWLYRALHKAGIASLPQADSIADGLVLTGVLITAVAHCAPPDNKPTTEEIGQCRSFLLRTLKSREWKSILCLGSIAWTHTLRALGERNRPFGHGQVEALSSGVRLVGSYHPSQQNTFTRRLTEVMLDEAVKEFLKDTQAHVPQQPA